MINDRNIITSAKRIVIKVGTSTLTHSTGKVNLNKINKLVMVLSDLVNQEKQMVLVTSGAIGVGLGMLKMNERPKTLGEKQAVAAVGQCGLMHIYSQMFSDYSHIVAQVLLTKDVVLDEIRRTNVINTFNNLLDRGIIPIVNENDTVSVEQIENIINFGDNDTLSAVVSTLINADLLIILSDVDGFYDCDPRKNTKCHKMEVVKCITPELEGAAEGAGTSRGTGGMATKIIAAKIATQEGVNMVLADGNDPYIINDILDGKNIGTLFLAKTKGG